MSKPWIHAKSSVKRYGGKPEDYLAIHDFFETPKGCIADARFRALTHNTWFISFVLEKVFGNHIINSDGKEVSVRSVGEDHVLEDFGMRFIPTAQDYLCEMDIKDWMMNGRNSVPPSFEKIDKNKKVSIKTIIKD